MRVSASALLATLLVSFPAAAAEPAPAKAEPAIPKAAPLDETPAADKDAVERENVSYRYIGVRYTGTVLPGFITEPILGDGAPSLYQNSIGIEYEMRKNGFSFIPALTYTEFGTQPVVIKEPGKNPNFAGFYELVESSMKGLYLTADVKWSVPISKKVDFEYGAGFGVGVIFGPLKVNWLKSDPDGPYTHGDRRFSECATEGAVQSGCNRKDHQNADVARVGGYEEPSWFNGGAKPNFLPYLAFPVGFRWRPIPQFTGRLGVGVALTGAFFAISGSYGLPSKE